jgi:hypothetical protein
MYKNSTVDGSGNTLYVDDTAVNFATIKGLTAPTSITDLTTGLFITGAINKGQSWVCIGDAHSFYFITGREQWGIMRDVCWFGDLYSTSSAYITGAILSGSAADGVMPTSGFYQNTQNPTEGRIACSHPFWSNTNGVCSFFTIQPSDRVYMWQPLRTPGNYGCAPTWSFATTFISANPVQQATFGYTPGSLVLVCPYIPASSTVTCSVRGTTHTYEAVLLASGTSGQLSTLAVETSDTWGVA